jgi:hypothetical protein
LKIDLEPQVTTALEHYSTVRNTVIHDQSVFEVSLDNNQGLQAKRKTCPRHPTPVRCQDLEEAEDAYLAVIGQIYKAVACDVLKCAEEARSMVEFLTRGRVSHPRKGQTS